jgi:hypothetical protein
MPEPTTQEPSMEEQLEQTAPGALAIARTFLDAMTRAAAAASRDLEDYITDPVDLSALPVVGFRRRVRRGVWIVFENGYEVLVRQGRVTKFKSATT